MAYGKKKNDNEHINNNKYYDVYIINRLSFFLRKWIIVMFHRFKFEFAYFVCVTMSNFTLMIYQCVHPCGPVSPFVAEL